MQRHHYPTSPEQLVHGLSVAGRARHKLFAELDLPAQAQILLQLPAKVVADLLSKLNNSVLVEILEQLDPDEATDILQTVPSSRRRRVWEMLTEDLRRSVAALIQFGPEVAAGLMSIDYIQVDHDDTISEVAEQVREHERRTGRVPAIFVMKHGKLLGYLPAHELGLELPTAKISNHVEDVVRVHHNTRYSELAKVFRHNQHSKVVVVGDTGNVMGILYSDDVLRIMSRQDSHSLYDFAGVDQQESVSDSVLNKVRSRYLWLIINLGTAFLAAFTVSRFDETISKYVLLAVYMPIVAGMGGNAATQTLAVMVRGIALQGIRLRTTGPILVRELGAALVNGIINGVIVAAVVILFNRDVKLALVLATAMVANLLVAAFFGTLVPLTMKRLGKDPATSATIFITTATDVLGFLVFLGLATLVLNS